MIPFPVLSIITWAPFVGAAAHHVPGPPPAARRCGSSRWSRTAVSVVLSVFIFVAYDREAAGFQFYEEVPLVPPLGISYELGVDGMSLLMVLLTSIIIFAGVFASWTVTVRSQEFYALLLALVTGVYGVFVSLDLFVLLPVLRAGRAADVPADRHLGLERRGAAARASSAGRSARPAWAPRSTRR